MNNDATLREVKLYLLDHRDDGTICPACRQNVKVYKRTVNRGMATSLIKMYRRAGTDWVNVPDSIGARSREEGKLRYWGLVEEAGERRPDGGRAGWWRVTDKGVAFIRKRITLPKYAHIYNAKCIDHSGPSISIEDALGNPFDYDALMRGEA